jgi:hypothetical protein
LLKVTKRLLIAGLAIVVCGCGVASSNSSSSSAAAPSAPTVTAPSAPAAPSRASAAAPIADWPMFGRVPSRTSATGSIGISAAQAPRLKHRTVALPGTVDSSPIFLHGVQAGGARRDLFLMTTTYGRELAVDAKTAKIVWTFTPSGYASWEGTYQITNATPVAKGAYVYSASPDGRVHKIAIANGREAGGRWPVTITRLPAREKVTPSFGLMHGRIVVGTGGYIGDQPPYQGHLVTIDPGSGRIVGVTNSLCANRHAIIAPTSCKSSDSAFWSRSGAVELPDGTLLFATGNANFDGRTDFGDSVIRVSGDGRRLLGSWTPSNYVQLNATDGDLGSTGPVLIGGGSVLQSGKDAKLHVFAVKALNHRGSVGHERQTLSAPGGQGMFTAPAVWRSGGKTYVFATTGGATAAYVQRGGRLHQLWTDPVPGTSPIVAGGLLYVYDPGGSFDVYNPHTGKAIARLPAGRGHWNSPAPGNGVIALPEGSANDHSGSGTLNLYSRG